jgi:hypothetical protein
MQEEVNVDDLKNNLLETEISKTESSVIISKIQEINENKFKDNNYLKKQTEKIFNLMNSHKLSNEEDVINNNTIINSPKFGEKTLVHINSMNTTEKNPSVGNYQITALSDFDSSENNPYKESLSSFRENIKISSDSFPNNETVRIIIINSYKKFFV